MNRDGAEWLSVNGGVDLSFQCYLMATRLRPGHCNFITGSLKHLGSENWCGRAGGGKNPCRSTKFFKQVPPFLNYCLQLARLAVTVTLRKNGASSQSGVRV